MKGQREDTSVRTAMRRRLEGTGVVRGRGVRAAMKRRGVRASVR